MAMKKKTKKEEKKDTKKYLFLLSFSALGVVYGDIGTSPLYAFRECFYGPHSVEPTEANVLGVLSLIFWSLILVISIKYLLIILRANNQGEGGILALMELVLPRKGRTRGVMLTLGLFGAALLYGDGTITPAISVLSAVEGLEVAAPGLKQYVIPATLVILFFLFLLQRRGTGGIGLLFGPVMLIWFIILAGTGLASIAKNTSVIGAVNPVYALRFFGGHGYGSLFILGAVFLVVTGGEALYADIGHFSPASIRLSWFSIVLPSLLLNYFGQGALLLEDPSFAVNPFYHLVPERALYPMIVLSTGATVIASQAIISGVFSLTFQSVQLGYLPRLKIRHTSEDESGQIYIPRINWIMYVVTSLIVAGFQSSSNLAAAYGIAVSTTMVITTVLAYFVITHIWKWPHPVPFLLTSFFLIIDATFLGANMLKITHGGWFPLVIAGAVYLLMSTWFTGREIISKQMKGYVKPLKGFIDHIDMRKVKKVPGAAVYMAESPLSTPPSFVHNLRHNKIIHQRLIFIFIGVKNVPHVPPQQRIRIGKLPKGAYRVLVKYGFMDRIDVRVVMRMLSSAHFRIDMEDTTFFVGRDTLIPSRSVGMSKWRDMIFLFMRRNSDRATTYFNIPPERAFEIGAQIKF